MKRKHLSVWKSCSEWKKNIIKPSTNVNSDHPTYYHWKDVDEIERKEILMLKLSLSSYLNFILISTIPRRWLIVTIIFIIIDDVNKKWKSCRVVRKQSFCKCSSSSLTLSSMMSFLSSSWTVLFDFSSIHFLYIAIMSIMDVPSKEKKKFSSHIFLLLF